MSDLFIPVILGTGRTGRQSEKVANYVVEQVEAFEGITTQLCDVKYFAPQFTIPEWEESEHAEKWRVIAAKADGFIVVLPEYNSSFPGEFKLMMDQAYKAYAHKTVAYCGVSGGVFGGIKEHVHILPLWKQLGLVHTSSVFFGKVAELFNEAGEMQDEKYAERMEKMLKTIQVYAQGLKEVREQLS